MVITWDRVQICELLLWIKFRSEGYHLGYNSDCDAIASNTVPTVVLLFGIDFRFGCDCLI